GGSVRVWEAATGREKASPSGHSGRVWSVAFLPGGKRLVSASPDGTVRLWEVAAGKEVYRLPRRPPAGWGLAYPVALSPRGRRLAARVGTFFYLWDTSSGKELLRRASGDRVNALTFSPDGKRLALCDRRSGDRISLCRAATGEELRKFDTDPGGTNCLVFSPD